MPPPTTKSFRWLNRRDSEPAITSLPAGEAVVFSSVSPDKESANEDGALLISVDEQRAVFAVADGCGGASGGEEAARLTLVTLSRIVKSSLERGQGMRAAILDGIERANAKVVSLGTGAAATLAVVELREGKVRTYHVGDSQILLVGNHGKVKLQTCAHSPVGYAVEAGWITEEEAIHHDERHIVSNVIGTRDGHIEVGLRRNMSARDTLLVGSDGVYDNLHLDEIVELIRKGPLDLAARRLAEKTQARMCGSDPDHPSKPDDVTFVLFRRRREVT